MASCDFDEPLSRKDVLKMRGRIRYQGRADGGITASKWPRRRGPTKTPLQQAWVDDFTDWAKLSNRAAPCIRAQADASCPGTGFFWRDVITYAGHGKFLWDTGDETHRSPLPLLWTERSPKQQYGAPRVTTPTAKVAKPTAVSIPNGTIVSLIPDAKMWDNNVFWSPTVNPERLTFRANGLYLCGMEVLFNSVSGGTRAVGIFQDDDAFVCSQILPAVGTGTPRLQAIGLQYFTAGQFIEAQVHATASGVTAQLASFWALAITPEAII